MFKRYQAKAKEVLDDISDEEGDVTDISESDDEGDVAGATEGAGAETDDAEGDVEGEDSDTEGEDGESDGESEAEKALCVGARVGQEVEALKRVGVSDSVGIDLVPYPPLVIQGDFHNQPFENETFDFEFSNVFDHALYPYKFVAEIERTLKAGGICVLHVAVSRRSDKYSANDLYNVRGLKALFRKSDCVRVRKVDGFGLDTELVFRKNNF
ncbi:Methyltransferase type 11 [Heracleum sosnowskyi]|uniref:Methyltransferase type 11 n=1 Tax=Heracleum sosnowskyi TaxID=360622 RepID=A0AAD8MSP9_9APIA|nr:Methyltransferase type 11 [Heracleum sosnowskyi]